MIRLLAAGDALYLNDALDGGKLFAVTHQLDSPRRNALSPKRGVGHMICVYLLVPEKTGT